MDGNRYRGEPAEAEAAGRARGRPKLSTDAEQRDRVVTAARELFGEAGYGGTTMDAVAARCGMSKRTLYRLFPTKIDLFKAMVVNHRRSMLALPRAPDDTPVEQALAAIFRLEIDAAEAAERTAFIRLALSESARFPEILEVLAADGAAASRAMLADWLQRQVQRGVITVPKPVAAARMLMDMIFGIFVRRFPEDGLLTHEDRVTYARECIAVFLNGVGCAGLKTN